jgi:hypothetical protein
MSPLRNERDLQKLEDVRFLWEHLIPCRVGFKNQVSSASSISCWRGVLTKEHVCQLPQIAAHPKDIVPIFVPEGLRSVEDMQNAVIVISATVCAATACSKLRSSFTNRSRPRDLVTRKKSRVQNTGIKSALDVHHLRPLSLRVT